jgi:hypothetical protein
MAVIQLKTIYQSLGIRLDLNGKDIGKGKGLLKWVLGTCKGVEVKCKK